VPPYFAGLLLAWLAVAATRSEPFDPGYLFFLQNYYDQLPFFLVSWSLCVEEHFYFFIPLIFALVFASSRQRAGGLLVMLAMVPCVARFVEFSSADAGFGYYLTATHLRADGLLLGFLASWAVWQGGWRPAGRSRLVFAAIGISAVPLTVADLPSFGEYVLQPLIVALGFLGFLLAGANHSATSSLAPGPVRFLAFTSYSVYLTHALVIHACLLLFGSSLGHLTLAYLIVEVGAILLVGWIFYRLVELPSMRVRERLAPAGGRALRAEVS